MKKNFFFLLCFLLSLSLSSFVSAKPLSFPFSPPLEIDFPDDTPNFVGWPARILASTTDAAVSFLLIEHLSPVDERYRVFVFVSRRVVDGKSEIYVFVLATAKVSSDQKTLTNIRWAGDISYLNGGPPMKKFVPLPEEPDFNKVLELQLRRAGSKI